MKILVVQLKRIGDLVLTTPLLSSLREELPGAEIWLAVEKSVEGLLDLVDHDHAVVFGRGKSNLREFFRLRGERFEWAFDLTGNDRSCLAMWFAAARRKVTYQHFAKKKPMRRWIFTDFVDSPVAKVHTADHHTALLEAMGATRKYVPSLLQIPPNLATDAERILSDLDVQAPLCIVHPGSVRPEKFWVAERWTAVVLRLRELGFSVLLTGSPAPMEIEHLREILQPIDGRDSGIHCLGGKLRLPELAALIDRVDLVCGVDSAPLHFADALGTRCIALFGPTCPHQWRPRFANSVVLTPLGDGPVGPEYYPGLPMKDIPTDFVLKALEQIAPRPSEDQST